MILQHPSVKSKKLFEIVWSSSSINNNRRQLWGGGGCGGTGLMDYNHLFYLTEDISAKIT